MANMELHRGRLIDHIQLVVADIEASRRFYRAVFEALAIPIGGEAEDYFWADELFVSTADSAAAHGRLTGRTHLAFQAADPAATRLRLGASAPGQKPAVERKSEWEWSSIAAD